MSDPNQMERIIAERLKGNWLLAASIASDLRKHGYGKVTRMILELPPATTPGTNLPKGQEDE